MAKKKSPPKPLPPTPERIAAAIRSGDFLTALEFSRQLLALAPTLENMALRKQALSAAATHYAEQNKFADFNRVMAEAGALDPENSDWLAERAGLMARGGLTDDALRLIENHSDASVRLKVLGIVADRAIRRQSKEFLPEDLHSGFEAVIAAFKFHEAGNESAAREALEQFGLRSPFLEWKLLLRGLLAYAGGDESRAIENFNRLDAQRLPARLATPIRAAIDPAFKDTLPPATASALLGKFQKSSAGPVVEAFRAIARELGRNKPLMPAFRAAESIIAQLKHSAPDLIPRLANCLYQAILRQGQPDDLGRYRKLFGAPAHDPEFWSLQARVAEEIGNRVQAHSHYQKYERWLASNPPGWSPALVDRARAEIWAMMGANAINHLNESSPEDDDALGIFGMIRPRKKNKPLDPPADACFRRAVDLAPDCQDAVRLLFETLMQANKPAEAEAALRSFLAIRPDNLPALEALANLLQTQGRAADAAATWLQALALNPLDKPTRYQTAVAIIAAARRKLTEGSPTDATSILAPHRILLEEQSPATIAALESVIAVKLGQSDEAARLRAKAIAVPGARIGAAYRMMVDSQLAKLKPADKKAADKLFAEEYAKPPTPLEANQLLAAYDVYHVDGVTYRGQKTHEKKVLDLATKTLSADAPEIDFERLAEVLVMREDWKHAKKLIDACRSRFPRNPLFFILAAENALGQSSRIYAVEHLLNQAKRLAETSTEPRHRALLDRIDAIRKELNPPPLFHELFGGFYED